MNRLEKHLVEIEKTLSNDFVIDESINATDDRLDWHLTKIQSLLGSTSTVTEDRVKELINEAMDDVLSAQY